MGANGAERNCGMFQHRYEFAITGVSPLIMHADDVEWADYLEAKRSEVKSQDKKAWKAGDDRCPPETWKGYLYNDGEQIVIPAPNIQACLTKAAAKVELKGKETFKRLATSSMLLESMYLPLLCDGQTIAIAPIEKLNGTFIDQRRAAQAMGFDLLVKRASIGQAKHVRVRPIFSKWRTSGTFVVLDEQLTDDVVADIWQIAGRLFGIGDWRPGSPKSPGSYGRFDVALKTI